MEFKRVSETKTSMRALARGQNALHDCFEDHRTKTADSFAAMAQHVGGVEGKVEDVQVKVDGVQAEVTQIREALGIGRERRSTVATMGRRTALASQALAMAGGGLVIIGVYKLVVAAWPAVWTFLQALNRVVLKTA